MINKLKIVGIETSFTINKQIVYIEFDNGSTHIFQYDSVRKITGLSPKELEILTGCLIIPEFYKAGQYCDSGMQISRENSAIRTFLIDSDITTEQLKIKNKNQLLDFRNICHLCLFTNRNKTQSIVIKLDNRTEFHVREKNLKNWTGIEPKKFQAIIGYSACPIYYKKGEAMSSYYFDINYCQADNKIVKTLNLRWNDEEIAQIKNRITPASGMNYRGLPQCYRGDSKVNIGETGDTYGKSYEKYNGFNNWSDDVIDDAFEGDPDATWNVD